jgi:hypothetical protein
MKKTTKPLRGAAPQPDHILLTLNGDVRHSRAVTWRTSEEITQGWVEYWPENTDEKKSAAAATHLFRSDIDVSQIHSALLEGLTPDTRYAYTCGDEAHRSPVFLFATAPKKIESVKFIALSDHQVGEPFEAPDYSDLNGFLKELLARHPDTAFFLTGGDNTDCGQHEQQWNGLFATGLAGVAEQVPYMMTLGNHDNRGYADYRTGTGRYYSEPAEFFAAQFAGAFPANGPAGWQTENCHFTYGPVQINMVGVNAPEIVNEWLCETVGGSTAPWKLGAYHFPICYSGANCQNHDAYPVMRAGFACFDLVFSGHEHNFSRSFPLRGEELHEKPSQGTVHYMLGRANKHHMPGCHPLPKVWHAAFYPQEEPLKMACVVEITQTRMTLTSVLEDGRVVDQCVIDKAQDAILPHAQPPVFQYPRMLFKGYDLGLCQANTPGVCRDGVWFVPLAVLIAAIGGIAEKMPACCRCEVYGHWAAFCLGSDRAQTDQGEAALPAPVFRGNQGQLYIPAEACRIFDMRWAYAPHNNFITFEHESEEKPVTPQP